MIDLPAFGRRRPIGGFLLSLALLLATSERLPAPISEESPTPAPEKSAKPKPRRLAEPKTNRSAKPSPSASTPSPTPSQKFAGTWSGIVPEVPWGNVQTELIVDPTETTMEWQESGNHKGSAKTQRNGNTLSARIPIGFTTAVWFISPRADGITADIQMTAFMNDDHAVFRRVSR
jgi:hypothetical protein